MWQADSICCDSPSAHCVIKLFLQLKLMSNDFLRKVWCHWTAGGLSDCYYGNNFKPFFAIFGLVEEGINLNWKNIYTSNLQKSWFSWTRYKTCADDVTAPNCRISSTSSMIPNIHILMDSNEHWFGLVFLFVDFCVKIAVKLKRTKHLIGRKADFLVFISLFWINVKVK